MLTGMAPRVFTMLVSIGVAARILRPARSSSLRTGFLARWKCPGGWTQIHSIFTSLNSFLKYLSKSDQTAWLPPLEVLNNRGNSVAEISGNRVAPVVQDLQG